MNLQSPPVLLTSSVIVTDRSVALIEPEQRIKHTIESIEKWVNLVPDVRLVICDGSAFDFSEIARNRFPGVAIECHAFENDKRMVQHHGKGYGEGEIIKYALSHSALLKNSNWFAKCTAKLWVDNFPHCVRAWNGSFLCKAYFPNVFSLKKTVFEYVDTRFYLVAKYVYFKHFSDLHLSVGGPNGVSLEHKFKDAVLANNLKHVVFRSPPVIRGMAGSGKYYRNNRLRRIKESLRYRIVQSSPSFGELFNQVG
jgi:hypothetical protein